MTVLLYFFLAIAYFLLAISLLIRLFSDTFIDGWPSRVDRGTGWSVETVFFFDGLFLAFVIENDIYSLSTAPVSVFSLRLRLGRFFEAARLLEVGVIGALSFSFLKCLTSGLAGSVGVDLFFPAKELSLLSCIILTAALLFRVCFSIT